MLTYARQKVVSTQPGAGGSGFLPVPDPGGGEGGPVAVVASLIATDPAERRTGRGIQSDLAQIFRRGAEEGIQPVLEGDVAEVLRRRFFTPASIRDRALSSRTSWRRSRGSRS